jgi:hypothetical protein
VCEEDGELIVELPPDAPRGEVEVIIKKTASDRAGTHRRRAQFDVELEELLSDRNFRGVV